MDFKGRQGRTPHLTTPAPVQDDVDLGAPDDDRALIVLRIEHALSPVDAENEAVYAERATIGLWAPTKLVVLLFGF